jgi:NitT/TauT family transport system substrate-binding protein
MKIRVSSRGCRLAALAAVLALGVAACSDGYDPGGDDSSRRDERRDRAEVPATPEQTNLRVGLLPTTGAAGFYLADQDGYFTEAGFQTVEQTLAVTGVTEALLGGEYDFVYAAYVVPFQARDQGLPVEIVAAADEVPPIGDPEPGERRPGVIVMPDSDIQKPKDLEGKTIGVPTVSIGELLLFPAMKERGIDTDRVQLVEVFIPNELQALEQGQVDAVFAPEPYFTEAEKTLDVRMVFDAFAGSEVTFPIAGYFTTESFAAENPGTVAAFRSAIERAARTLNEDRQAFTQILSTYLGITADEAAELVPTTYATSVNVEDLQRVADTMRELGLLEKKLAVADMVAR